MGFPGKRCPILKDEIAILDSISKSIRPIASKFSGIVINCEYFNMSFIMHAIGYMDISMNVCPWGFRGNAVQF